MSNSLELVNWNIEDLPRNEVVSQVTDEFNNAEPHSILREIHDRAGTGEHVVWTHTVSRVQYAWLGSRGDSVDEAVMLYNPIGNYVTEHQLVRAEFTRRVLEAAGVRSEQGDTLPVLMIGSPSGPSGLNVTCEERKQLAVGDFNPFVSAALSIAQLRKIEKLSVAGHSLGGVLALSTAATAREVGMDVSTVAASDAVCSKPYNLAEMAVDFTADAERLREEVRAAGLEPYTRAQGMQNEVGVIERNRRDIRFVYDALVHGRVNLALAKGMAAATFAQLHRESVANADYVSVAHGSEDQLLAPFHEVRDMALATEEHYPHKRQQLVEVEGAYHTWGDNLPAVTDYVLSSMLATH